MKEGNIPNTVPQTCDSTSAILSWFFLIELMRLKCRKKNPEETLSPPASFSLFRIGIRCITHTYISQQSSFSFTKGALHSAHIAAAIARSRNLHLNWIKMLFSPFFMQSILESRTTTWNILWQIGVWLFICRPDRGSDKQFAYYRLLQARIFSNSSKRWKEEFHSAKSRMTWQSSVCTEKHIFMWRSCQTTGVVDSSKLYRRDYDKRSYKYRCKVTLILVYFAVCRGVDTMEGGTCACLKTEPLQRYRSFYCSCGHLNVKPHCKHHICMWKCSSRVRENMKKKIAPLCF